MPQNRLLYYVLLFNVFLRPWVEASQATNVSDLLFSESWNSSINRQLELPHSDRPGQQDLVQCCAFALRTLQHKQNITNFTDVTIDPSTSGNSSQYSCGATYNGSSVGAPVVHASYKWSHSHCPGWEASKPTKPTQWLQPFVGFILPSVIFCLNVPRRRKIQPPQWVFPSDLENWTSIIWAIWCAANASIMVTFDTIFWLCVVFALARPLLLSGVYEALVDKRVVDFMMSEKNINHLPFALRTRILVAVLVGNLDLGPTWNNAMAIADSLDQKSNTQIEEHDVETRLKIQKRLASMLACQYSFGSTIGAPIVFYIGSFIYTLLEIRSQLGDNDTSHALAFGMWWTTIPHIAIVSGCLLAGNNPNTLEAIVPGEITSNNLRQTIPPISVKNSKRAPDSIGADHEAPKQIAARTQPNTILPKWESTYEAQYKPTWMWERGRSKREWLFCLIEVHERDDTGLSDEAKGQLQDLRKALDMEWGDWLRLSVLSASLFLVPCTFGFLVSFFTPQIGLSCRSFTVLMYACSQTALSVLWLWDFTWRDQKWRRRRGPEVVVYREMKTPGLHPSAMLDRETQTVTVTEVHGNDAPEQNLQNPVAGHEIADAGATANLTSSASTRPPALTHRSSTASQPPTGRFARVFSFLAKANWAGKNVLSQIGFVIYMSLGVFFLLVAVSSAIGGTLMQLIGVYRTYLCQINVSHWFAGRDNARLNLSTNTSQDIRLARHMWLPVGAVAVGFLAITAWTAWWYQKRLRFRFTLLLGDSEVGILNTRLRPERKTKGKGKRGKAAEGTEMKDMSKTAAPQGNGCILESQNGGIFASGAPPPAQAPNEINGHVDGHAI